MLAALRAAAPANRPVLGVACGSLGALTPTVEAAVLPSALDRFAAGDWTPERLPALQAARGDGDDLFALNDISVVRAGIGQVRTVAEVDGILFCRIAGDAGIVSTPLGSSAYALAAGGPLLAPGVAGYVLDATAHPRRLVPTAGGRPRVGAGPVHLVRIGAPGSGRRPDRRRALGRADPQAEARRRHPCQLPRRRVEHHPPATASRDRRQPARRAESDHQPMD